MPLTPLPIATPPSSAAAPHPQPTAGPSVAAPAPPDAQQPLAGAPAPAAAAAAADAPQAAAAPALEGPSSSGGGGAAAPAAGESKPRSSRSRRDDRRKDDKDGDRKRDRKRRRSRTPRRSSPSPKRRSSSPRRRSSSSPKRRASRSPRRRSRSPRRKRSRSRSRRRGGSGSPRRGGSPSRRKGRSTFSKSPRRRRDGSARRRSRSWGRSRSLSRSPTRSRTRSRSPAFRRRSSNSPGPILRSSFAYGGPLRTNYYASTSATLSDHRTPDRAAAAAAAPPPDRHADRLPDRAAAFDPRAPPHWLRASDLTPAVKRAFSALYERGKLTFGELDASCLDHLGVLSELEALQAVTDLDKTDFVRVRNLPAFFVGICRKLSGTRGGPSATVRPGGSSGGAASFAPPLPFFRGGAAGGAALVGASPARPRLGAGRPVEFPSPPRLGREREREEQQQQRAGAWAEASASAAAEAAARVEAGAAAAAAAGGPAAAGVAAGAAGKGDSAAAVDSSWWRYGSGGGGDAAAAAAGDADAQAGAAAGPSDDPLAVSNPQPWSPVSPHPSDVPDVPTYEPASSPGPAPPSPLSDPFTASLKLGDPRSLLLSSREQAAAGWPAPAAADPPAPISVPPSIAPIPVVPLTTASTSLVHDPVAAPLGTSLPGPPLLQHAHATLSAAPSWDPPPAAPTAHPASTATWHTPSLPSSLRPHANGIHITAGGPPQLEVKPLSAMAPSPHPSMSRPSAMGVPPLGVPHPLGPTPSFAAPAYGHNDRPPAPGEAVPWQAATTLRQAITEYVKEVMKPAWKSQKLTREAFKTIAKKAVEKVLQTAAPNPGGPPLDSREGILGFMTGGRQEKIRRLVGGYLAKYEANGVC